MKLFTKRQPENFLAFIPIRVIQETSESEGKIILHVPKFKNERLRRIMVPGTKSPFFRIHLDDMGSHVWRLVDDYRNVEEICGLLKTKLQSEEQPTHQLDERITKYLTDLYKNRFIRFKK